MNHRKRIWLSGALLALILAAVVLPVRDGLPALHDWALRHPGQAVFVFSALVVLATVLMVPVSIQAVAAGMIFGLAQGMAVMWLAGLTGFVAAFLAGRSLARPWIETLVSQRPEFAAVDRAIGRSGLTVVILSRLALVLPYSVLNYSLGLTGVSLRDYLAGSAVGMVPGIFLFVFLGSTATDVAAVVSGELRLDGHEWWLGAAGLLLALTTIVVIARRARSILRTEMEKSGGTE